MSDPFSKVREKIISIADIGKVASRLKGEGKRIVTLNGAFDILHPGHIYFLQEARDQGDVLIAGLNSDVSVKRNKGARRPINDEESRAIMLAALQMVDFVTIFNEDAPLRFIEAVRPSVHCNGEEYGKDCVEAPTVKELGAELYLIPRMGDWSTTKIEKGINK